jgi:hypothetical protein
LYSLFDVPVVGGSSKVQGICGAGSSSRWQVTCALGSIPLNAGTFYASIWFGNQERDYASFSRALSIHVESADPFGWGNKVLESTRFHRRKYAEEPGFWPNAFNHHAMYRVASPITAAASV